MWILITISLVYGGQQIHTQEFKNKATCETASKALKTVSRKNVLIFNGCFKK